VVIGGNKVVVRSVASGRESLIEWVS
jgi:hypothetical protein